MIQATDKLVQIKPVTDLERSFFRLDTTDGRMQLADRIHEDIDEWCQKAFDDGPRNHLGASIIGGFCDRNTWMTFRWIKHKIHSGRMQRLFQDGHWYEERFIEMLQGIGCEVRQVDPQTGKQYRISFAKRHGGGSSDGILILSSRYGAFPPMICEFKTINEKGFLQFHDVEYSKPEHWGQICIYGFMNGIQHAVYFQVNKNDADMRVEVVELDWLHAQTLIKKAGDIIASQTPPPRISNDVSWWQCKFFCDHYRVCQLGETPDRNCRSCRHSSPVADAKWHCNRWNIEIPNREAALQGCTGYEQLPL